MNIPKLKRIKSEKKYHDITIKDEYSWVDQPDILEVLKDSTKLLPDVKKYIHSYPHCWRTDKPILYYPLESWFINTTKLKSKLANQNILAIVCGHIHINQTNFWHGIPIIISNGLYSTIDFLTKDEMRIIEGKSFNVCHIRDNGIGVTVVPVKPTAKVFKSINVKKFKNLKI